MVRSESDPVLDGERGEAGVDLAAAVEFQVAFLDSNGDFIREGTRRVEGNTDDGRAGVSGRVVLAFESAVVVPVSDEIETVRWIGLVADVLDLAPVRARSLPGPLMLMVALSVRMSPEVQSMMP
jgi:hypothetical protein